MRSYPALGSLIGCVRPRRSRARPGTAFFLIRCFGGSVFSVRWNGRGRLLHKSFGSLLPRSTMPGGRDGTSQSHSASEQAAWGITLRGQTSMAPAPIPRLSHAPSLQRIIPRSVYAHRAIHRLGAPKTEDRAEMGRDPFSASLAADDGYWPDESKGGKNPPFSRPRRSHTCRVYPPSRNGHARGQCRQDPGQPVSLSGVSLLGSAGWSTR